MTAPPHISFIIPVCNEADTLKTLYEHVVSVLKTQQIETYRVIFIDDGSTDQSWKRLEALKAKHSDHITAIRFRRNYGKAAALSAGFEIAEGDLVITMDADLQDDPEEIPLFLDKLNEGYDCVSGWKQFRKDPIGKTLPSRLFNWATRAASGVQLHDFNCGFKGYQIEAIKQLDIYGELHRYIPVLLAAEGFSIEEVPVRHHRRTHGVSKYGWKRLFKGAIDLITVIVLTRYLKRPGHFFGGLGMVSGFTGFMILSWLSIEKIIFQASIGNRPMLLLGVLLMLLGVQLISTGLIGELIHSTRFKKKANPIRRTL